MDDCVLTTYDNPWNPFTHWDEWYAFDLANNYNTCGLLARVAHPVYTMSDEYNEKVIDEAMQTIVEFFPFIYRIVYKENAATLFGN